MNSHLIDDLLYHNIIDAMDFSTFYQYCKTNKAIYNQCKNKLREKLEEEIQVPLIHYNNTQINKIAKMVINKSFRQDILLNDHINLINENNYLVIAGYDNVKIIKNHQFIKMASNMKKNDYRMPISALLLLDDLGNVWPYDYITFGKPLDLPPIIDISYYKSNRTIFVIAIAKNGKIYAKATEDEIDDETKFIKIGHIPGAVKVAVGQNHCVVLTDINEAWFFSHNYYYQILVEDKDIDHKLVRFVKFQSNVKQICVFDDTTLCLTNQGVVYYVPGYREGKLYQFNNIIHIKANNEILVLLDDQGNLYQMDGHDRYEYLTFNKSFDDYKIDKNVCNMAVGSQHDVVWINNEGLYSMGNKNWKGSWRAMPDTVPLLYEHYNPL